MIHQSQENQSISILFKIDLSSTSVAADEEEAAECFRCLWPFLSFSRLIGLCPISRRRSNLMAPNLYSLCWFPTYISLFLLLLQFSWSFQWMVTAADTDGLIDSANGLIYYLQMLCTCLFMAWRTKEIPKFLVACKRIDRLWKKYEQPNDGLVRDCLLLFCFFVFTQLFENVLYYYNAAIRENVTTLDEYIATYTIEFFGSWGFYSGIFSSLGGFYCALGWNFGDTAIGLLSLLLTRFFIRMNRVLGSQGHNLTLAKIEDLRRDHQEICRLVQLCNEIFSPLFLLTFAGNIGFLLTRLYVSLEIDFSDSSILVRLESIYAFFQQIFIKIFLPSYLAAKLNERAHEGLDLVHDWPSAVQEPCRKYRLLVIGRFVSQFETTQIGLSGSGFFIISKSFVVTLISALVTYEVIILQFLSTGKGK